MRPCCIVARNVAVDRKGFRALMDVNFEVDSGKLVGVVGPNGAGKSTLFDAVAGVLPLAQGDIELRGSLAYVPQRDNINWTFPATVHDVVMMGRYSSRGWFRRIGKRDHEIVQASLERTGLCDCRSAPITELSGGQRQRTFIARALAQDAGVLLLDEAFSGVDVATQEGIVDVLQSLRNEGRIVLVATHDLTNMAERFDLILCINRHVCAFGPPSEAFTPDVLEEMYGAHVMEMGRNGVRQGHAHA